MVEIKWAYCGKIKMKEGWSERKINQKLKKTKKKIKRLEKKRLQNEKALN